MVAKHVHDSRSCLTAPAVRTQRADDSAWDCIFQLRRSEDPPGSCPVLARQFKKFLEFHQLTEACSMPGRGEIGATNFGFLFLLMETMSPRPSLCKPHLLRKCRLVHLSNLTGPTAKFTNEAVPLDPSYTSDMDLAERLFQVLLLGRRLLHSVVNSAGNPKSLRAAWTPPQLTAPRSLKRSAGASQ